MLCLFVLRIGYPKTAAHFSVRCSVSLFCASDIRKPLRTFRSDAPGRWRWLVDELLDQPVQFGWRGVAGDHLLMADAGAPHNRAKLRATTSLVSQLLS